MPARGTTGYVLHGVNKLKHVNHNSKALNFVRLILAVKIERLRHGMDKMHGPANFCAKGR